TRGLLLLSLSALFCWVTADIHCHSCNKIPVLGCVNRQSCQLRPGHRCLTTNVYLGTVPSLGGYGVGGQVWA
uniref:Lymphocyte antigen 6 family member G6C n=1 Tax=Cavia porcellus TaxID=10141 RepID=A0A286XHH1_CAVPO